jgi:hypothetical protein
MNATLWFTLITGSLQTIVQWLMTLKMSGQPVPDDDKECLDAWVGFADGQINALEKTGDADRVANLWTLLDRIKELATVANPGKAEPEPPPQAQELVKNH